MIIWQKLIRNKYKEHQIIFQGDDCFVQNVSYKGNDCFEDCDLQPDFWKRDSAYKCQLLCQEIDQCTEFTWISPGSEGSWKNGRNRCCLKNETSSKPEIVRGRVSGPKFCDEYFAHIDTPYIEGSKFRIFFRFTYILIRLKWLFII